MEYFGVFKCLIGSNMTMPKLFLIQMSGKFIKFTDDKNINDFTKFYWFSIYCFRIFCIFLIEFEAILGWQICGNYSTGIFMNLWLNFYETIKNSIQIWWNFHENILTFMNLLWNFDVTIQTMNLWWSFYKIIENIMKLFKVSGNIC